MPGNANIRTLPACHSLCDPANASANIQRVLISYFVKRIEGCCQSDRALISETAMDDEQPVIKVVDRRPFNPDGTPRELSAEERGDPEVTNATIASTVEATQPEPVPKQSSSPQSESSAGREPTARPRAAVVPDSEASLPGRDPLDDPASFLSLIMSLASNAAASLGMMPHPVSGETGVDLKTAKHWIDVLGMLDAKTQGNLDSQEAQVLEGLLADLRMQYVSFSSSPPPASGKFSASDITGGK